MILCPQGSNHNNTIEININRTFETQVFFCNTTPAIMILKVQIKGASSVLLAH
jgi:hypothetical protein